MKANLLLLVYLTRLSIVYTNSLRDFNITLYLEYRRYCTWEFTEKRKGEERKLGKKYNDFPPKFDIVFASNVVVVVELDTRSTKQFPVFHRSRRKLGVGGDAFGFDLII